MFNNKSVLIHLTSNQLWKRKATAFCGVLKPKDNRIHTSIHFAWGYNTLIKQGYNICKDCADSKEFGLCLLTTFA